MPYVFVEILIKPHRKARAQRRQGFYRIIRFHTNRQTTGDMLLPSITSLIGQADHIEQSAIFTDLARDRELNTSSARLRNDQRLWKNDIVKRAWRFTLQTCGRRENERQVRSGRHHHLSEYTVLAKQRHPRHLIAILEQGLIEQGRTHPPSRKWRASRGANAAQGHSGQPITLALECIGGNRNPAPRPFPLKTAPIHRRTLQVQASKTLQHEPNIGHRRPHAG